MKLPFKFPLTYQEPSEMEILEAYLHKSSSYNRADARKIKRALRKLSASKH